jgi:hypothetical protein
MIDVDIFRCKATVMLTTSEMPTIQLNQSCIKAMIKYLRIVLANKPELFNKLLDNTVLGDEYFEPLPIVDDK